jgi:hypothetical protein
MPASRPSETVTRTVQVRVAWAVALITVALVVLGVALLPSQEWRLTLEFVSRAVGNSLFILACSVVGLLIVSPPARQCRRLDLRPGRARLGGR